MELPKEEMILDDEEDENDDVINEEEVDCEGVRRSSRESVSVERLEPHWYNEN